MAAFQPNGIVTLTTDFGLQDAYVGIMKGVILSIAPHAQIVDYTHGIHPGNILQAAHLLDSGYRYFPHGTIHVVVVDPGVGSTRRAIALQTPEAAFVGPDNGLFSLILETARQAWGTEIRLIELTESRFWLSAISATFHGRDIFAPVAAHLVRGTPVSELGTPVAELTPVQAFTPQVLRPGVVQGRIIHVDRFGNCITNLTTDHLHAIDIGRRIVVDISDQQLFGLFRTYSDGPTGIPMCLIGSSGQIELAVRNGSAAKHLGVDIGDKFRVRHDESVR